MNDINSKIYYLKSVHTQKLHSDLKLLSIIHNVHYKNIHNIYNETPSCQPLEYKI